MVVFFLCSHWQFSMFWMVIFSLSSEGWFSLSTLDGSFLSVLDGDFLSHF